ncbi:MAG TPA: sulfite exporter TauE/SafE family protein [Clostridia bacterium]|nr:sulfite exporter TauE/SafE family protein [Clostridia bacterium]
MSTIIFVIKDGENLAIALVGAGIGFLNGFLGGGGGILVVCALVAILKLPQKEAHATAILVILPITIISAVVYVFNQRVDWLCTVFATIGVIAGGLCGAVLLKKLDPKAVQIVFCSILVIAGIRMFF